MPEGMVRTIDWRTGAVAMVISLLLIVIGIITFVCILLRRNKPNDPWSRFMKSPIGRWFRDLGNWFASSPPGLWIQKCATQVGRSSVGIWIKTRWASIHPATQRSSELPPQKKPSRKEHDLEYGVPDTPIVAELDADQRLGSPGNPAELDGFPRWSPLRWSRTSASTNSAGVVSRVKTWLVASTQPKAAWTKSIRQSTRQSRFDSDGTDRPMSVKSSRSEKSGYFRESADWGNFSPASLKVPTAAHITRAHQRNNSLASVMDPSAKTKIVNERKRERDIVPKSDPALLHPHDEREGSLDMMNRLSTGTFGAGRASQLIEAQSTDTEPVPMPPLPAKAP